MLFANNFPVKRIADDWRGMEGLRWKGKENSSRELRMASPHVASFHGMLRITATGSKPALG